MQPELSLVIPTFNEAGSVGPLVERLEAALAGISWEALFVDDDSPDGTAESALRKIPGSFGDTQRGGCGEQCRPRRAWL